MTNFTVFLNGGGDFAFDGDSIFEVLDGGVLRVHDAKNKRALTFGPASWQRVEESTDYDIADSIGF